MEGLIPQLVYQKYKDLLHLKRYGTSLLAKLYVAVYASLGVMKF